MDNLVNPALYLALKRGFRDVRVKNPGIPRTYKKEGVRLRIDEWGEQYEVNCLFCSDDGHKLWIASNFGAPSFTNEVTFYCHRRRCQRWTPNFLKLLKLLIEAGYNPQGNRRTPQPALLQENDAGEAKPEIVLPYGFVPLHGLPANHQARLSVKERGFWPENLSLELGVGFAESNLSWAPNFEDGRLVIPLYAVGPDCELVLRGWLARALGAGEPRYLTSSGARLDNFLYNAPWAAFADGPLVVVEGPTDCWTVGEPAVALLGKSAGRKKIEAIRRVAGGRDIAILLDEGAENEASQLARALRKASPSAKRRIVVIELPSGFNDPAEAGRDAVWEAIHQGLDSSEQLLPRRSLTAAPQLHKKAARAAGKKRPETTIRVVTAPACGDDRLILGGRGANGCYRVTHGRRDDLGSKLASVACVFEDGLRDAVACQAPDLLRQGPYEDLGTMQRMLKHAGVLDEELVSALGDDIGPPGRPWLEGVDRLPLPQVADQLREELEGLGMLQCYEEIEKPLLAVVAEMCEAGVGIDLRRVAEFIDEAPEYLRRLLPTPLPSSNTGRVLKCRIKPLGAETGRLTVADPALPNLKKDLRGIVVARPKFVLLVADQSNYELRVLAGLAGDEQMIRWMRQGLDPYVLLATRLFGVSYGTVSERMRDAAKDAANALIGGARTGERETQEFLSTQLEWLARQIEVCRRQGFVQTVSGRRRRLDPDQFSPLEFSNRVRATLRQGNAADLFKTHLVQIDKALPNGCRMLLPLHDGLLLEVEKSKLKEAASAVAGVMEQGMPGLDPPLSVSLSYGESWGTMKPLKLGLPP